MVKFSSDTREDAGGPSPITWHWAWPMERYKFGPGALTNGMKSVDDQEAIIMIWAFRESLDNDFGGDMKL